MGRERQGEAWATTVAGAAGGEFGGAAGGVGGTVVGATGRELGGAARAGAFWGEEGLLAETSRAPATRGRCRPRRGAAGAGGRSMGVTALGWGAGRSCGPRMAPQEPDTRGGAWAAQGRAGGAGATGPWGRAGRSTSGARALTTGVGGCRRVGSSVESGRGHADRPRPQHVRDHARVEREQHGAAQHPRPARLTRREPRDADPAERRRRGRVPGFVGLLEGVEDEGHRSDLRASVRPAPEPSSRAGRC